MTPQQRIYLSTLASESDRLGHAPVLRDLARATGRSRGSVHAAIARLRDAGYVEGRERSLRVTDSGRMALGEQTT